MGRKKVPAKIKMIRGTFRNDRDGGRMDVISLNAIPMPPAKFAQEEKDLWMTICGTLHSNGLLQSIGINQINIYCEQHRYYRDAAKFIEDQGLFLVSDKKNYGLVIKRNPAHETMTAAYSIMRDIAKEFGFTPAAQAKLKTVKDAGNKAEEADEFDNI